MDGWKWISVSRPAYRNVGHQTPCNHHDVTIYERNVLLHAIWSKSGRYLTTDSGTNTDIAESICEWGVRVHVCAHSCGLHVHSTAIKDQLPTKPNPACLSCWQHQSLNLCAGSSDTLLLLLFILLITPTDICIATKWLRRLLFGSVTHKNTLYKAAEQKRQVLLQPLSQERN